ncbi:glycosyltransferase family 4 protein [Desulfonatronum thiosulfatophilum]|nr:glycosyltransferase family 4 protein [Desulfonatronum thiosulfatophilum]
MTKTQPRIWGTLDPFLESGAIWGRRVANEQFLSALFDLDPFDAYHFFLATPREVQQTEEIFRQRYPGFLNNGHVRFFLRHELPKALRTNGYHCFHLSDCINHPPALARLRNAYSDDLFPVTSVTHSLSYPGYPAQFLAHLWSGCTARDGIIATSRAGKGAVQAYFTHLRRHFELDAHRFPQPEVSVIPLGMKPPSTPAPHEAIRRKGRDGLKASDETCVMLVLGRISPHAKMDLLPLLRAWQRIAPKKDSRVLLVIAGWVEPRDDFPETFSALARNVGLPIRLIPRPDDELKQELYTAADIFISLADNPQETFGLTLLEAGLAGLPVIAADYSGYRDIVLHEQTGYLIPTIGPKDSDDIDMLSGLIPDYEVQFLLAQQTAVLVPALAEALRRLIDNPELRRDMGRRAELHVRTHYSWPDLIRQHLALWDHLWEQEVAPLPGKVFARPLELPYAGIFAGFHHSTMDAQTRLRCSRIGEKIYSGRDFPVIYAGLEDLVTPEAIRQILFCARKPVTFAELVMKMDRLFPQIDQATVRFCLHWALKHDLLEIMPEEEGTLDQVS